MVTTAIDRSIAERVGKARTSPFHGASSGGGPDLTSQADLRIGRAQSAGGGYGIHFNLLSARGMSGPRCLHFESRLPRGTT